MFFVLEYSLLISHIAVECFLSFQVNVTEIFDVTDSEAEGFQSITEKEANTQLEYDNDWADDQINLCDNG